jgi:RNA polymerase sigma-70 factor (ECF subfamily)
MTTSRTPPEAEDLLGRARAGEASALGQLLASVEIGRRLQGKLDASDLAQETFLEAHRDFAAFRGTTEAELAASGMVPAPEPDTST